MVTHPDINRVQQGLTSVNRRESVFPFGDSQRLYEHLINLSVGYGDNHWLPMQALFKESQKLLEKNFLHTVQLDFHNKKTYWWRLRSDFSTGQYRYLAGSFRETTGGQEYIYMFLNMDRKMTPLKRWVKINEISLWTVVNIGESR